MTVHRAEIGDLGPAINAVNWFLLACIGLAVGSRTLIKLRVLRRYNLDDWLLLTACGFAIAESICIMLTAFHGAGQHQDRVSDSKFQVFQKSLYAADMLVIPTVALTKLSMCAYIYAISLQRNYRFCMLAIAIVTVLWAISSLLVTAFRCNGPRFWAIAANQCIDILAFSHFLDAFNLFLEAMLVVVPIALVWSVQMPLRRKLAACMVFAARILVFIPIIGHIVYTSLDFDIDDLTYESFPLIVCNQVTQCACILVSWALYSKIFLEHVQSGMIRLDDLKRRGQDPSRYNLGSSAKSLNNSFSERVSSVESPRFPNRSAPPLPTDLVMTVSRDEVSV